MYFYKITLIDSSGKTGEAPIVSHTEKYHYNRFCEIENEARLKVYRSQNQGERYLFNTYGDILDAIVDSLEIDFGFKRVEIDLELMKESATPTVSLAEKMAVKREESQGSLINP